MAPKSDRKGFEHITYPANHYIPHITASFRVTTFIINHFGSTQEQNQSIKNACTFKDHNYIKEIRYSSTFSFIVDLLSRHKLHV